MRNCLIITLLVTQTSKASYTLPLALGSSSCIAAGATYGLVRTGSWLYPAPDGVCAKVAASTFGMCAGIAWNGFLTQNIGHRVALCASISLFGAIVGLRYAQRKYLRTAKKNCKKNRLSVSQEWTEEEIRKAEKERCDDSSELFAAAQHPSDFSTQKVNICLAFSSLRDFIADQPSLRNLKDQRFFLEYSSAPSNIKFVNPTCFSAFSYLLDGRWHLDFIAPHVSAAYPFNDMECSEGDKDALRPIFAALPRDNIGEAAQWPPQRSYLNSLKVEKIYKDTERQLLDAFLELLCVSGGTIVLIQFNAIKAELTEEIRTRCNLKVHRIQTNFQNNMGCDLITKQEDGIVLPVELQKRGLIQISSGETSWIVSHMIIPQEAIDCIQETWKKFRTELARNDEATKLAQRALARGTTS